jgi:alpha-glucosidase
MDEAFSLYEHWGVAGVKVDFIERDDQVGIDGSVAIFESREE